MKSRILIAFAAAMLSTLSASAAEQAKSITWGSKGTVLLFVASGCPCTDQHRIMVNRLVEETRSMGIEFYCVFSNEGETVERIDRFYRGIGWTMPFIKDTKARLADEYQCTQTPTAVLVGRRHEPLYRGPIDDGFKLQGKVEHAYLKDAVHQLLGGEQMSFLSVPPSGCWIVRAAKSAMN